MMFIGDVHGEWNQYLRIINEHWDEPSIQVGDFGVGFGPRERWWDPLQMDDFKNTTHHRFIRGNHDNPEACREHPLWIPDGTIHNGVFCVGGGLSIDKEFRTHGVDWWPDEELSIPELDKIIDEYERVKPEIVVSHDCPEMIAERFFPFYVKHRFPSRTREALKLMFQLHQPRYHIFGHWHVSHQEVVNGTHFRCLAEHEWCII